MTQIIGARFPQHPATTATDALASARNWRRQQDTRETAEDHLAKRCWTIGFFAFYGALVLLLGGFTLMVDWPSVATSRSTRPAPSVASIEAIGNPH